MPSHKNPCLHCWVERQQSTSCEDRELCAHLVDGCTKHRACTGRSCKTCDAKKTPQDERPVGRDHLGKRKHCLVCNKCIPTTVYNKQMKHGEPCRSEPQWPPREGILQPSETSTPVNAHTLSEHAASGRAHKRQRTQEQSSLRTMPARSLFKDMLDGSSQPMQLRVPLQAFPIGQPVAPSLSGVPLGQADSSHTLDNPFRTDSSGSPAREHESSMKSTGTLSDIPMDIPTDIPSNIPFDIPSNIPSNIPSTVPSNIPSKLSPNIPLEILSISGKENDLDLWVSSYLSDEDNSSVSVRLTLFFLLRVPVLQVPLMLPSAARNR